MSSETRASAQWAALRKTSAGSLKRGGRHHDQLEGAAFLGEVETAAGYALEPVGEYLALVAQAGAGNVSGELFEISQARLPALDNFEGEAYFRGEVSLSDAGAVWAGLRPGETALAYFKKPR